MYIDVSRGCKEAIWLKGLLCEFGNVHDKVNALCHSQITTHLANNPTYDNKTKKELWSCLDSLGLQQRWWIGLGKVWGVVLNVEIVRVVTTITLLATKVMNRFDKGMMYCCKGRDCWSCDNNNPCSKFYGKNIFT